MSTVLDTVHFAYFHFVDAGYVAVYLEGQQPYARYFQRGHMGGREAATESKQVVAFPSSRTLQKVYALSSTPLSELFTYLFVSALNRCFTYVFICFLCVWSYNLPDAWFAAGSTPRTLVTPVFAGGVLASSSEVKATF